MDHAEFFGLTEYLALLYEERFPSLTTAMAKIWYEDMKHLDEELVHLAIRRWARHHSTVAPGLDQLLEQVEIVRDEQRRGLRAGSSTKGYGDILRDAAETQATNPERTEAEATYGRLLARIGERSVLPWQDEQGEWHPKMTLEQRATQCYEWANRHQTTHPALAEELRYAARTYARIYHEQHEEPPHAPGAGN